MKVSSIRIPMVAACVALTVAAGVATRVRKHTASPSSHTDTGGIGLRDVAASSGLTYRWNPVPHRPLRNIDAFGCGCAFFDFDGDGYPDILLVGSPTTALYRNDGHGHFSDVSREAGLVGLRGHWNGCAVGDYDGDGRLDVLLTGYHRLALLHNEGGKRFRERTSEAGLSPQNWSNWGSSAGFMDLDGDGHLDLVVLNYVISGPGIPEYCELHPGVISGCPPQRYQPEFGRLLHGRAGGTFEDVTRRSGFSSTHGKALVVGFIDTENTGKMDFYLGNDGTPADFLKNLGQMRFRNVALQNGTIYTGDPPHSIAGMGIDVADFDRDGQLDFAVSAFSKESYPIFHNDGNGLFSNVNEKVGTAAPTLRPLGFGTKFADLDNDGWPDLVYVNGHVYDRVAEIEPGLTFRQPWMVFRNEQGRHFTDLAPVLGGDLARPILGRGLAAGDFDNDGRIDLLAVDLEGGPVLLHNESKPGGHWITLDLRSPGPNRFGYGARVTARSGTQTWVGQVSPASSYLSSSDPRVHFGLGAATRLDRIDIRWPSGRTQTIADPEIDRLLVIDEPQRPGVDGR